jgi:hypothetical protein
MTIKSVLLSAIALLILFLFISVGLEIVSQVMKPKVITIKGGLCVK